MKRERVVASGRKGGSSGDIARRARDVAPIVHADPSLFRCARNLRLSPISASHRKAPARTAKLLSLRGWLGLDALASMHEGEDKGYLRLPPPFRKHVVEA